MFKKEYLLVFVVIGLALVYVLFSLLVFFTRGKSASLLGKKLAIAVAIISFGAVMNSVTPSFGQAVTPDPAESPLPTALYGTMPPTPDPQLTPDPVVTPENTPVIIPVYAAPTPEDTAAPVQLGDVNSNGVVDIVDALLIAQYYVGLNPANFNAAVADVNASGKIDVVDAMLVAQKYVGIIDKFPGQP